MPGAGNSSPPRLRSSAAASQLPQRSRAQPALLHRGQARPARRRRRRAVRLRLSRSGQSAQGRHAAVQRRHPGNIGRSGARTSSPGRAELAQPRRWPAVPEAGGWVRLEVAVAKVGFAPGHGVNGWAFTQHDGTVFGTRRASSPAPRRTGRTANRSSLGRPTSGRIRNRRGAGPGARSGQAGAGQARRGPQKLLRDHFLQHVYTPAPADLRAAQPEIAETKKVPRRSRSASPATMVMAELAQPRETFVLVRGAVRQEG